MRCSADLPTAWRSRPAGGRRHRRRRGRLPLSDELALVSTADFFTPIVDDPYDFGRIAATNALSDVYAMGGTPLTALNLVAFSLEELGGEVLREILRGGADVAAAAGVAHRRAATRSTTREPKYGLAVTGTVHPDRLVRNSTARAGDELWLTKPVGGGVASTAIKRGTAPAEVARRRAVRGDDHAQRARRRAPAARGRAPRDDRRDRLRPARPPARAGRGERRGGRGGCRRGARASTACSSCSWRAEPPVAGGTRRNRDWIARRARLGDGRAGGAPLAPVRRDDLGRAAGGRPAGRAAGARACASAASATGEPGRIGVSA